jgi:triosephosphate isomerase
VNIAGYLRVADGVLVGGASLGADFFIELMRTAG